MDESTPRVVELLHAAEALRSDGHPSADASGVPHWGRPATDAVPRAPTPSRITPKRVVSVVNHPLGDPQAGQELLKVLNGLVATNRAVMAGRGEAERADSRSDQLHWGEVDKIIVQD